MRFNAAMAASARYSCTKPITALSTTMAMTTMVSVTSPIRPEMTAAAISTRIMKSANWARKIPRTERVLASAISLGPN
jgi:hypothetical protein